MKGIRGERLAGEYQIEISKIISGKLRNNFPSLSVVISVTKVDVAPDLKSARVFVSIYDTDKERAEKSFETLKQNAAFIRHELSKVMTQRTVPELRFALDGSAEYGEKIDRLLSEIEKND